MIETMQKLKQKYIGTKELRQEAIIVESLCLDKYVI